MQIGHTSIRENNISLKQHLTKTHAVQTEPVRIASGETARVFFGDGSTRRIRWACAVTALRITTTGASRPEFPGHVVVSRGRRECRPGHRLPAAGQQILRFSNFMTDPAPIAFSPASFSGTLRAACMPDAHTRPAKFAFEATPVTCPNTAGAQGFQPHFAASRTAGRCLQCGAVSGRRSPDRAPTDRPDAMETAMNAPTFFVRGRVVRGNERLDDAFRCATEAIGHEHAIQFIEGGDDARTY